MLSQPFSLSARVRLACLLVLLLLSSRYARAQAPQLKGTVPAPTPTVAPAQPARPAASPSPDSTYQPLGDGATVKVSFPNVPIQAIIPIYEDLTGRKLILDSNLQGNQLRIVSKQLLTKKEAIAFIEANLLMNGYAFVHVDPVTSKLVNHSAGTNVSNLGLPVYNSVAELPQHEEICHYVLPLQYVAASDAAKAIVEAVKPHTYGSLMPVANDTALLITENSSTIRAIIRMAEIFDVPPTQVAIEMIKLERANVENVAEIIEEFFSDDEKDEAAGAASFAGSSQPPATGAQPSLVPGMPRPAQAAGSTPAPSANPAGPASTNRGSSRVKVRAYLRTNELLVQARPVDITQIRALVEKLDKQDDGDTFRKFRLSHLNVLDFLPVAHDTLAKDTDIETESGGATSGGGRRSGGGTQRDTGTANSGTTDRGLANGNWNSLGNGAFSGGSGFGGNGMGTFGGNRSLLDDPQTLGSPESVSVGKTHLIADPQSNSLIVDGSPEHIARIERLLQEMDIQPQQIYITAIIGQLSLGNNFDYGFDFLKLLNDFSMREAGAAGGTGATGTISFPGNFKDFAYNKLNFYGQIGSLSNYLKVIDGNTDFKVLANPSVFARNAAKSVISSGQRIAVPANILSNGGFAGGVASNSVSVEYREVLLKLEVIPLVNNDDKVTLRIAQTNDNIVGSQIISGNTVPTIGAQELVTEVTVKDGSTVVLGGLITERVNDSEKGVIFLRRIPLLKHLFTNTTKTSTREELLIFIQPHIIKESDIADGPNRIERGRSNLYEEALDFSSPELRDIPRALPYTGQ